MDLLRVVFTTDVRYQSSKVHSTPQQKLHETALAIVTFVAFLTRFVGLEYPSFVVFDEAHTLRFTSWYLQRSYFFDVHPPFGRFIYVLVEWLCGYDGHFTPTAVGESYITEGVPYLQLRSLSALLSTLTVSMVYLVMWESGYGVPACVAAAGMVVFDTAQIAQTRLIYIDAPFCLAFICCLYGYIRFSKLKRQAFSRQWWTWLFLTGLALCCDMSIKYVGLFAYITIGTAVVIDLWELFNVRSKRGVGLFDFSKHFAARGVAFIIIPFLIYLFWFYLHFAILIYQGDGDDYMSEEFANSLINNSTLAPPLQTRTFLEKYVELQDLMLDHVRHVLDDHPYKSRPWQWPIAQGGVGFWVSAQSNEPPGSQIYHQGSLPGWLIASSALPLFVGVVIADQLFLARGVSLIHDKNRKRLLQSSSFFALTWLTHYVPFWFTDRQLMLHSYLPAHLASTLLTGSLLHILLDFTPEVLGTEVGKVSTEKAGFEDMTPKEPAGASTSDPAHSEPKQESNQGIFGSSYAAWAACCVILCLVFAFWLFWLPLTYGQPSLTPEQVQWREIPGVRLYFSSHDPVW